MNKNELIPIENVANCILLLRGQKVMLDADLAKLYCVKTKALNQAVKRNIGRFPQDFMFQLSPREKAKVVTKCDHLQQLKFSAGLPYAFTEHGAVMLASILNSPIAVEASIQVVRAFIHLRGILSANKNVARKLKELEKKYDMHDTQIQKIFAAIRQLMAPEPKSERRMGFRQKE